MKDNFIEEWKLMPPRGHWRTIGWRWEGFTCGNATWVKPNFVATLSAHLEDDGKRWMHLGVSHIDRTPSYEELCEARRAFLNDRLAYQLFVPAAEHFSLHPHCLHLWAPLDHRPTPDFRHGDGGGV